jgi:benzylsuccinate CoA-transferase BbsE subunit
VYIQAIRIAVEPNMKEQKVNKTLLEGYRALDMTDEKGFFCGRILGDLGADVIKIERPGGDAARNIGPFYHDIPDPEKSLYWFAFNTNKRGITLDIETADGRDIFTRLVKSADFVLESFNPGYMDSLGLGYSSLEGINPGIIVTSITPFGQTGPYKNYKASDLVLWGLGGMLYVCGEPDGPPVQISFPQAYIQGSAEAAAGTMMALYHRQITGEGQHVDVALQECIVWIPMYASQTWDVGKVIPRRRGPCQRIAGEEADRRLNWTCKDGFVSFGIWGGITGANTMKALVEWMDSEGKAPRVLKEMNWDRLIPSIGSATQEHFDKFEGPISEFFASHTKAELYKEALNRGFMLCPGSTIKDVLADPQLSSRDFWVCVEHPELHATITYPGPLAKASESSCGVWRRAPLIGEHNQEVYREELGFSQEQLTTLKQAGVI